MRKSSFVYPWLYYTTLGGIWHFFLCGIALEDLGYSEQIFEEILLFVERNLESLNTTKYCICHSDLHFDNILVDENDNISILDYDRLRISSIDYELDALFTMVNSPDLILHIEKKAIPPNAFECAIPLVLKNYPELFDFPNLQKRLSIYAIKHYLSFFEQYKEEAELEIASESFDADNSEDSDGQITLGI